MADELETRLSAALHAYAEQVEEPAPRPLPAPAEARSSLRRWRAAALVAAAVAVVTLGAVWAVGDRPGGETVAGASATAERSAEDAAGDAAETGLAPYGTAAEAPAGAPGVPAVGVPVPLDLYTHCGVFGTDIDGTWFAAEPPLLDGPGNPPPDWGNPVQAGTLTRISPVEALFTDDVGHSLVLRAAPESARPAPCD